MTHHLLLLCLLTTSLSAAVTAHPAPGGLPPQIGVSARFSVEARQGGGTWLPVAVYDADPQDLYQGLSAAIAGWDPGHFACIECDGPLSVRVTARSAVTRVDLHPRNAQLSAQIRNQQVELTIAGPGRFGIELDGEVGKPLWLFISPPLVVPATGTIRRFPAGTVTIAGDIPFGAQDTIVIENGAVVVGQIIGRRDSGRILGTGVLVNPEENSHAIWIDGDDVVLRGPVVVGQSHNEWTIGINSAKRTLIEDLKVLGIRRDALDPIGCSGMTIRDCFLYSYDDPLAVKAKDWNRNHPMSDLLVERTLFWHHGIAVGFESQTDEFRNLVFRDCDIIHPRPNNPKMPGEWTKDIRIAALSVVVSDRARVSGVRFEDIRIVDPVGVDLFIGRVAQNYASADGVRGHIDGVLLKNIHIIDAKPGEPHSFILEGFSADHAVNGVVVDNLRRNGEAVRNAWDLDAWTPRHVGAWSIVGGTTTYAPVERTVAIRLQGSELVLEPRAADNVVELRPLNGTPTTSQRFVVEAVDAGLIRLRHVASGRVVAAVDGQLRLVDEAATTANTWLSRRDDSPGRKTFLGVPDHSQRWTVGRERQGPLRLDGKAWTGFEYIDLGAAAAKTGGAKP
jgi:hypothetical protein